VQIQMLSAGVLQTPPPPPFVVLFLQLWRCSGPPLGPPWCWLPLHHHLLRWEQHRGSGSGHLLLLVSRGRDLEGLRHCSGDPGSRHLFGCQWWLCVGAVADVVFTNCSLSLHATCLEYDNVPTGGGGALAVVGGVGSPVGPAVTLLGVTFTDNVASVVYNATGCFPAPSSSLGGGLAVVLGNLSLPTAAGTTVVLANVSAVGNKALASGAASSYGPP
jgi:hypothetical protein